MGPRCYYDEAGTYFEGRYDRCCFGYSCAPSASVPQPSERFNYFFHRDSIPPFPMASTFPSFEIASLVKMFFD
jgi:hypothetical protein